MKKFLKILSVALTVVLIVTTFSIGMTAYAAADDVAGDYAFEITSTYKDVDWQNWKAYKAATHVHTTRSDADIEVDDQIEEYYSHGYDALALTDHGTVNYGWTSGQSRIAIFGYQAFVHGGIDEPSTARYNEITSGTGAVKGGSGARGYGMTEIPKGIELNGMSTKKCHINGFFVDAGHGVLGTTETWPRSAVKTNYDAGGVTHINHVGEWAEAKNDIGVYDANFVSDFASVYEDYCPNRPNYSESTIRGCLGMELVNTTDNRTRNDRYLYDETMKLLAPQGINMFVFCEDDSHEASDCDKNAQYFIMPSNDKQAKNIEYSMKHGQFYTCSKNSKNPYELGDGFSASGAYPSVSYVGVDDAKNQIIVTVKNANKARMVADGSIVETIDTTLSENTVVFDLNKFEDKINSYVRVYFTGPGGILYLQTFLVKKTVAPRASVQFITPSGDTDVSVYNSNHSLVAPANSDYLYFLEPGNYTYVASRPGYLTTDEIPFTVTQEEYDAKVKKQISVSLEINSDLVYSYFYVPETIYLSGTDRRTFESYVDRENSPDGRLNSSPSTTGSIFFEREGATDINITYRIAEGENLSNLTAEGLSSDGPTLIGTIRSGSMISALGADEHAMIEWTAHYKCGGTDMVSTAYSYIYAPVSGASSAIAAGGFAQTKKNILGWPHSTMDITATTWAVGLHGISGGYAGYKFSPYGGQAVTSASGVGNITVSGSGMGTADDNSSGGSKDVTATSGKGTLMIDTSRYTNYGQIPGFRFGMDINNVSNDEDSSDLYVNFNGQRVFTRYTQASTLSGKRVYESDYSHNKVNYPIDTTKSQITISGYASCSKESRHDSVTGNLTIELSYVNKASLRERYLNAVKMAYQPGWFDTDEFYTEYINAIQDAERVLGNPAANATEISDASSAITSAMNGVELVSGTATVNYVDAETDEVLDTQTVPYTITDTIVVSSTEIEGYTFTDTWTETSGKTVVAEGTGTYNSFMTLKPAYTFNFAYTPDSYAVTFVSPDETYEPDVSGSAVYNRTFTLPSNVPSKTGYDFAGWHLDINNSVYPAGGLVDWDFTQDGEFTAEWTPKTYTAVFDINGGIPSYEITSIDVTYDDIFDIPSEIPEKEGYAFEGWEVYGSDNNLIGTFTAGGRFVWDYTENLTFKAMWAVVSFTVSFDSKGGSDEDDITVIYGSEYGALPVPVREGYNFEGWYLEPEYITPVTDTTVVSKTEDHTLYAKWSAGSYTITYNIDGEFYARETYDYGEEVTPLANPSKDGYTFSGWSQIPATMPANDVVVNGSYSINKYKLTYKIDGAVYREVEYNYGASISPIVPESIDGFRFSGWTNLPAEMPANDVVATGYYIALEYTITYYVDGALFSTANYYYGDPVTMLTVPAKTGFTFSGWDQQITTMPASNVSVYGTYSENEYNLNYYVDGELYETQVYKYQQTITPLEEPSRAGYDFSGWSVIPSKMPARDVTVNGSFTLKQISYYFLIDNKIISKYTIRGTMGTAITAPVPEAPENYAFSGWSPEVPDVMGAETMFFYGSYVKAKSFVEFDLQGGSGNVPAKAAYAIGSEISLPRDVSKSGFVFGGWAETADAGSGFYSYTVTESDAILCAVWNVIPASIEPADDTTTVVDTVYKLISGLCERLTADVFENSLVEVTGENADITIEQGIGFGTGSKAILTQNGSTVEVYEIVIYGDIDGDGIADGRDVQLAQLLAAGMLTKDDVSPAVYEAADCNHDGEITEDDVQLIINSGIFTETIDQTK